MIDLRTVSATLAAVLLLAACVSTEKRFDKAQTLEAEGRYAEAAAYYIKVLDREPDYADARARLADAGQRAIDQLLEEADAANGRADFIAAFETLDRLDALRADAAGVGVVLDVPDTMDSHADRACSRRDRHPRRRRHRGDGAGDGPGRHPADLRHDRDGRPHAAGLS